MTLQIRQELSVWVGLGPAWQPLAVGSVPGHCGSLVRQGCLVVQPVVLSWLCNSRQGIHFNHKLELSTYQ